MLRAERMRLLPNVIKTDDYFVSDPNVMYQAKGNKIIEKATKDAKKIIESANKQIAEAEEKAKEILAAAMAEAEEIKSKAFVESKAAGLEKGLSEGREIGFKQGYADAVSKFNQEVDSLIIQFEGAVETLYNAKQNVIDEQQAHLPDIVVAVSSEIIGKRIDENLSDIQTMVENALEGYRSEEWINIYLSPRILARIKEQKPDFLENIKQISPGAKLFACREFDDADCVIELKNEVLDISVDSQLEKIKRALKK